MFRTWYIVGGYKSGLSGQRIPSTEKDKGSYRWKINNTAIYRIFINSFRWKIQSIYKKNYHIDIKVVFNTTEVKHYFSLKCLTPQALKAKVVYKFDCVVDSHTSYIGKTKRHLATRVKEHAKKDSAIKTHLGQCDGCNENYGLNLFRIIDSGVSDFDCKVKEAIHIKAYQPNLNRQLFQSGALFTLNVFK